jgi:hypothetical protein
MGTNMALEHVLKTLSADGLLAEYQGLILDKDERQKWLKKERLSRDGRLLIEDEIRFINNSLGAVEHEISRRMQEWNTGGAK